MLLLLARWLHKTRRCILEVVEPTPPVTDGASLEFAKSLLFPQGRSQDFSKQGSQTGTPSGDRRLYMVYTTALPRVSAFLYISLQSMQN